MSDPTLRALRDVVLERGRQEQLHAPRTCANPEMSEGDKLAVLVEEVGEVAKALLEGPGLRDELVHVAAVAVAWVESIDSDAARLEETS